MAQPSDPNHNTAPASPQASPAVPPGSAAPDAAQLEHHLDNLEHRLADLQRQVQRLQRLASVGTIATILAHEFNNLLTPILSYSQYALTSDDSSTLKTAVEKSYENAKRMATMCSKVLGTAVEDQMGPTETQVRTLLADSVECIGRDLDKDDIQLTIDAADDLTARLHAGSLQQVLFNLVLNARQAMLDRPGRLTLAARRLEDGRLQMTVADTGCGIKREHIDRIFEPFFSTKEHGTRPDRRGLGLGLHICKQIVEDLDGEITVQSTPGRGTTFTIILPADS